MVKELVIIKKPRSTPIPDKPIAFPPLDNLQLELLEVKEKLKKNLPPIKIAPRKPQPKIRVEPPKENVEVPVPSSPKKKDTKKETPPVENPDDDLVAALGKDDNPPPIEVPVASENNDPREAEDSSDEEPDVSPSPEQPAEQSTVETEESQQTEAEEMQEYLWRFKILKKKYKNRNLPEFNEHDDLAFVKKEYHTALKDIELETNVDSYRTYLYGGFMFLEWASVNWMGIDLKGFASHQMNLREKYDVLLIELGERSYNRWGLNLPVELRLIGYILLNAGLFYLGKIIEQKGGGKFGAIFSALTGQVPERKRDESPKSNEEPRKRMRGPSIHVEDLKNMRE